MCGDGGKSFFEVEVERSSFFFFFFPFEASKHFEKNAIWTSFHVFLTFVNSEGITTGSLSAATEMERDCCCLLGARAGPRMREPAAADFAADDDAREVVCIVSRVGMDARYIAWSYVLCFL